MAIAKDIVVRTRSHLSNTINYITRAGKTEGGSLVSCVGCSAGTAYADFFEVKKQWKKTDKILAHQFIHAFPRSQGLTYEQAHELSCELAKKAFPGYQYVVATHTDADNTINSHIVVNSVNEVYGYKYKGDKKSLAALRMLNDEICLAHGLPIIEHTSGLMSLDYQTIHAAKNGRSWKVALSKELTDIAKDTSLSLEQVVNRLSSVGFSVKVNPHNLVITPRELKADGTPHKAIRLNTLARQLGQEDWAKHPTLSGYIYAHAKQTQERTEEKFTPAELDAALEWRTFEKNHIAARKTFSSLARPRSGIANMLFAALRVEKTPRLHPPSPRRLQYKIKREQMLEKTFGNIAYRRLLSVPGKNTSIYISPSQLYKLDQSGVFYSGLLVSNDAAKVTFKSANDEYIKQLFGVQKIQKVPRNDREVLFLARKHEVFKAGTPTQKIRFAVSNDTARELDANAFPFELFGKNGSLTATIFKEDLERFCKIAGLDYAAEQRAQQAREQNRAYAKLKHIAKETDDKIVYRVVSAEAAARLRESDFDFALFSKGERFNAAFLQSKLKEYERAVSFDTEKKKEAELRATSL